MVLRDPRVTEASMTDLRTCTDCARRLLDRGFKRTTFKDGRVPDLALGDACEVHPRAQRVRPQATTWIEAPEDEATWEGHVVPIDLAALATTPPEGVASAERFAEVVATAPGDGTMPHGELRMFPSRGALLRPLPPPSVTEIATSLVVAWSSADGAERYADDAMIDAAVQAARKIVEKTGGQ